jgi:hypothetical protein
LQYYISFINNHSRHITIKFLKEKSEAWQQIQNYVVWIENQLNQLPKAFKFDNGGKFIDQDFQKWLAEKGIESKFTVPHSPQQHGMAKWLNWTLLEIAQAMLIMKGLPKNLWVEAVSYTVYIQAQSPTRALHNKTPMEAWMGIKPDVSNLHEFGFDVWVLDEGNRSKLDLKANKFFFVGIEEGLRAIRYYNPKTHKILISWNFKFNNSPDTPSQVNLDLPIPSGNSNSDPDSAQIEGEPQEPKTHNTNSPHNPISSLEPILPTRHGLCKHKTINYTKLHNPGMRKEIVPTQQNKPDELSPMV